MKKPLLIFFFAMLFMACERSFVEPVLQDEQTEKAESRAAVEKSKPIEIDYDFIGLMVGEELGNCKKRTKLTKEDAKVIKSLTRAQIQEQLNKIYEVLDSASIEEIEYLCTEQAVNLFGSKYQKVKNMLIAYATDEITEVDNKVMLTLTVEQKEVVNGLVRFTDEFIKPFSQMVLNSDTQFKSSSGFDSAKTHAECHQAAVDALIGIGFGLVKDGWWSMFAAFLEGRIGDMVKCFIKEIGSKAVALYILWEVWAIYFDFDDCLHRVYGWK